MANELVPLDQPYGERQKFEAGMQLAGQATSLPTARGAAPVAAPQRQLGFDPLTTLPPPAGELPLYQPTVEERMRETMLNSPNALVREAARRILGA